MLNRLADYLPLSRESQSASSSAPGDAASSSERSLFGAFSTLERLVKDHPGAALSTAFIVGATFAWWIKRT